MLVKELIDELKKYDETWELRIAWFRYGNYNIQEVWEDWSVYEDTHEDEEWNVIDSKDVVLDLWDF